MLTATELRALLVQYLQQLVLSLSVHQLKMDKENRMHTTKKDGTLSYDNMDEIRGHYVKGNKLDEERHTQYDISHM